jgi:hypothetical protein
MKTGTVKTSSLLIPKLKTLREFGESVTDAEVANFDELVEGGFIDFIADETEKPAKSESEKESDKTEKGR